MSHNFSSKSLREKKIVYELFYCLIHTSNNYGVIMPTLNHKSNGFLSFFLCFIYFELNLSQFIQATLLSTSDEEPFFFLPVHHCWSRHLLADVCHWLKWTFYPMLANCSREHRYTKFGENDWRHSQHIHRINARAQMCFHTQTHRHKYIDSEIEIEMNSPLNWRPTIVC